MKLSRLSHPFIVELKRYVANQKSNLSPIILAISDIVNTSSLNKNVDDIKRKKEIFEKQRKLSEVADMIHAAYVFHRCIQDENLNQTVKRDNIMSLLLGDYLLAQSSVDLADIRYPQTVGLIARGLEDFTRGEMMKLDGETKKQDLNMDLYAELTCGSLLGYACRSAAIVAGKNAELETLVYNFGLNLGSAHRLIECCSPNEPLSAPMTSATTQPNRIEHDPNKLKMLAKGRLKKAFDLLFQLPNVEERSSLKKRLEEMMLVCR